MKRVPQSTPSAAAKSGGEARSQADPIDGPASPSNADHRPRRRAREGIASEPAALNATDAAELLGVGRTRFWQLRKLHKLKRVSWSSEKRPLYRREDVLALVRPQGGSPARPDTRAERMRMFAHLPELPEGWDKGCVD